MQVKKGICNRKNLVRDKGCDLSGDGSQRITGPHTVEVQPINRRCAFPGHHGMDIVGW